MSRKDTILIAVLINMALLVVMFIVALKPADKLGLTADKKELTVDVKAPLKSVESSSSIDQVDQILSKYVEKELIIEKEPEKEVSALEADEVIAPFPVAPEEASIKRQYKEVIVKQGDVLEKIARNHHSTVADIMRINKMNSTRLQIGQILYVPTSGLPSNIIPTNKSDSEAKYYTVKNGDNPWTIAIKNGIKVEELLRLNSLNDEKAKKLKPGDRLRIR